MTTREEQLCVLEEGRHCRQMEDRPDMLIPVLHEVQTIAGNCIQK